MRTLRFAVVYFHLLRRVPSFLLSIIIFFFIFFIISNNEGRRKEQSKNWKGNFFVDSFGISDYRFLLLPENFCESSFHANRWEKMRRSFSISRRFLWWHLPSVGLFLGIWTVSDTFGWIWVYPNVREFLGRSPNFSKIVWLFRKLSEFFGNCPNSSEYILICPNSSEYIKYKYKKKKKNCPNWFKFVQNSPNWLEIVENSSFKQVLDGQRKVFIQDVFRVPSIQWGT